MGAVNERGLRPAAAPDPSPAPRWRPRRLLVVEDDEGLGRLLHRVLSRARHQVQLEQDGLDGLTAAFAHSYDAIVLDIMLPHIDGLALLRYLRGSGIDTPVLVISARDGDSDRAAALAAGADDYLVKPFPMAQLQAWVDATLR